MIIIQTRTIEQIAETLRKCEGIRILVTSSSFRRTRYVIDTLEKIIPHDVFAVQKCSDKHEIRFNNLSKLIGIPCLEHNFCGERADQVIITSDMLERATEFLPLLTETKFCPFMKGIFQYVEPDSDKDFFKKGDVTAVIL